MHKPFFAWNSSLLLIVPPHDLLISSVPFSRNIPHCNNSELRASMFPDSRSLLVAGIACIEDLQNSYPTMKGMRWSAVCARAGASVGRDNRTMGKNNMNATDWVLHLQNAIDLTIPMLWCSYAFNSIMANSALATFPGRTPNHFPTHVASVRYTPLRTS